MKPARHLRLAIGLAVAALVAASALLLPSVLGKVDRHEAVRGRIEQLQMADSRFRELVISLRHGITSNYDEGNHWIRRIQALRAALREDVAGMPALRALAGDPPGEEELEGHWNDFKQRNALVRNSLRYLRSDAPNFLALLPHDPATSRLHHDLMVLDNDLLMLALGEQNGEDTPLDWAIVMLRMKAPSVPPRLRAEFDRLVRHAEIIVRHSPQLSRDMRALVHSENQTRLMRLADTNNAMLLAEQSRAARYRAGLLISVLVLTLILAALALRYLENLRRMGEQGAFFKSVSDNVGVGVLAVDGDDRITFANPVAERLLAPPAESLVGRRLHADGLHVAADGQAIPREECEAHRANRQSTIFSGELYMRRGDGTVMPVYMTTTPWLVDGRLGSVAVFQDISERLERERALRLAGTVFESSQQGIVVTDAGGNIIRVNPAYCQMTGYSQDELLGSNPRILKSGLQDKAFYLEMWESLARTGRWQGEMRNRRRNGEHYTQWANIDAVRTEHGDLLYVGIATDISELVDTRERLANLAYFDPLTGLPNRVLFRDRLGQAVAQMRREGRLLALIYADLDNFKTINDTLGHAIGDELLVEVGRRLRHCVNESDTVARLGGDEFALIIMDARGAQEMASLAGQITSALALPYLLDGHDVTSGVSLGITFWPTDSTLPEELLKYADVAMYRAKEKGRNNFQFFTGDMAENVVDAMRIETGLRNALGSEELALFYQPQIAGDGRAVAAEALMRWHSPELGWVPPSRFIPVAEKSGLITVLGDFALREACRQCRSWRDALSPELYVSVNLSAAQFRQEGLPERIAGFLHEFALPGEALELEITETVVMDDVNRGQEILNRLKRLGCRIAIDDFGTGYSSLAYLKRFPVDVLKIDKSFVDGLATDSEDTIVVQAIASLATSLGLQVVAEGVETLTQLEVLKLILGQDGLLCQGYFFSPPVPAAEFEQRFPAFRQLRLVSA